ncbi:MarR family transcriptional regulator [Sphingomonas sp. BGYR3]|uniref:MarR family winged helix-turn-helix transcriptional regulator n=1 Tax=Sphingomonas sp. BGYR3 TaxID=2975483 RepID=UPI002435EAB3|nr:MarR family transcriptional regulator [Sphingomonas sp. BGYR3]MDG5489521.1 MarR family transcriptional regulator [Sphingomonas sp. BGYR3]
MTDGPAALHDHHGHWLRLVSGHVSHRFARAMEAEGVTVAEWVLLRALHGAGAVPPSELAGRMGMTRGAITKLVDRLTAKGLLVRARGGRGDRRYQTLALTGQGAALVPVLARIADATEAALFGVLNARDRQALLRLLQTLVERWDVTAHPVE